MGIALSNHRFCDSVIIGPAGIYRRRREEALVKYQIDIISYNGVHTILTFITPLGIKL